MHTIKIGGFRKHTIELYDSIKEITAERDHALNCMITIDLGIGADMDSVAEHFNTLHEHLSNGHREAAQQEAVNLHNNFFMMIEKINTKSLCFALLVKSIDKQPQYDLTDEGCKKVIRKLSHMGLRQSQVEELLSDLKKKLSRNFIPSFLIDMEAGEMQTS